MSKSFKSQSSVFVALSAIAILASLLYGRVQGTSASQQESQMSKMESQEKVREVRGVVTAVDLNKKEIVIDLSGEDSSRLGGKSEARIQIDDDTKIKIENNTKGTIFSVTEGAPVKIKLSSESDVANAPEVKAEMVKLELACKATQGCPKSGECGRACGSATCSCPLTTKSPSPSSTP